MPFELKLALRYLLARKRTLTRFTAAVAVVGIAAGVAALILADSLSRGFADEMRDKILNSSPHITMMRSNGGPIENSLLFPATWAYAGNIADANVSATEHAVVSSDIASGYAILRAVGENVRVGSQLADRLGVKPGDKIEIVTLSNRKPVRITIDALLETGISDYDATRIDVPAAKFAGIVGDESFLPRTIEIRLIDAYRSEETAERLRLLLGPEIRVVEWQETNRNLFAALLLERRVAVTIIALIIFVAALNISATLTLLAQERRFDIGVLRACGARPKLIGRIFLIEGLLIGVTGSVTGIVVGLAGCAAANRFRLVSLAPDVYSLNFIPFHPSAENSVLIALSAIVLAVAAAVYPARAARRLSALDNLRAH